MSEKMMYEKATVYQLAFRMFTPEGTIRAAIKMLPFLAELGPEYIQLEACCQADEAMTGWSMRQTESGRNNPKNSYRITDYYKVDEEYGTNEDLKDFVEEAHRLGLKVVWDLVYLHCGPNAVFLKDHKEYVHLNEDGSIRVGEKWPFPQFNYSLPEVREYLWKNMTGLVEEFDFDGYRCDVGDRVPLDFWEEGVKRVHNIKPDFIMINEGENPDALNVFDANYFYDGWDEAVKVPQGLMSASDYQTKIEAARQKLPLNGRFLRQIDNHDVCSDCGDERHEKTCTTSGVDALLVLNFTLDGIPFVLNGYEFADALPHSMFSNRFYGPHLTLDWGNILTEKGQKRFKFLRHLFSMRKKCSALWSTELQWLSHSAPEQVISFIRPDKENPIFTIINLTDSPITVEIPNIPEKLHLLQPELECNVKWEVKEGKMKVQMLGYGYLSGSYPV